MPINVWSDVSSIANAVQEDAYFVVRENGQMQTLVKIFDDEQGMNLRKSYAYNKGTAVAITDADDLSSKAFTPSVDQTLTPAEIGLQFFITDARMSSSVPEDIRNDAARELGLAGLDQVETHLISDMASLTGGTIGTAGGTITWGYLAAAIAQAKNANKSSMVPLVAVMHEYQWSVLAKSASIAGATVAAVAGPFQQELTESGYVARFMNVPIKTVFASPDSSDDFTGGVFPRIAIAIDWRRNIRVEPERDASRRGWELNMTAVYAHGVWRPALGVKMTFDATAPTS
jgi:hypothetical protein